MSDSDDLRNSGLKATLPRIKVLDVLRHSETRHMTVEDIYRRLGDQGADIGLATVYRVVAQLEAAGILARHSFDAGRAVYELDHGRHHDHLICVACGRVEEFNDPTIEARQQVVAAEKGFALAEHRLTLYGRCAACRTDLARN